MLSRVRIASIGELLVELVRMDKNSHHLTPGLYQGPFPSGAPGIFIDQAAKIGAQCLFVGAVGADAFGEVVVQRLRADGVDTQLIRIVPDVPTGSAFVSYNDDGSRDFVYNIGLSAATRFSDTDSIAVLAGYGLDFIHISGSALGNADMRAKILSISRSLHQQGVKLSFDPNIRKELMGSAGYFETVHELLAMSSIFMPSEEDAAALFPQSGLHEFAPQLFAQGVDCVVLKKGASGCEALHRDGTYHQLAAHNVEVLDPTGAGDCFCATCVALWASGAFTLHEVLARANAAGALAVTKMGPMEGNSDLATIEAFLAARA